MDIIKTLQQIDGIDETIAGRLVEHGFDSLAKLAAAGKQDLVGIAGLNKKTIADILQQAGRIQQGVESTEETLSSLVENAARLRADVERLVLHIRSRFENGEPDEKQRKALRKETARTLATLESVDAALSEQLRRLGKGLARADAKIAEASDQDVEDVTQALKKARRKIEQAID